MEIAEDNDYFYTPETIAWKLYQDDDDTPLSSKILGFGPSCDIDGVDGVDGVNGANTVDHVACVFEMLLSIFCEMLIHMMKIDVLKMNEENLLDLANLTNSIDLDFEDFDMELYYPVIRNKFKKISYLVSVETFDSNDDKDYLLEVVKDRHSRVILRHNLTDTYYFDEIDSDNYYDFIPCLGYKSKKKIKDVYSILSINDKMYRIRFDPIEKIGSEIIRF